MRLLPTSIKLASVNILAFGLLIISFELYNDADMKVRTSHQKQFNSYRLADELRQSSDDLTRLARTYVTTANPLFEQQYWDVVAIRNGKKMRPENYHRIYWDFVAADPSQVASSGQLIALNMLMQQAGFTDAEFALLQQAQNNSDELIKLEDNAINTIKFAQQNATPREERDKARLSLYSPQYHQLKAGIMRPINDFFIAVERRTQDEIVQHESEADTQKLIMLAMLLLLIVTFISTFVFIYFRIIKTAKVLSESLTELTQGNFDINIDFVDRKDEFGDMSKSALTFRDAMQETTDQNWIKTHANKLSEALQKVESVAEGINVTLSLLIPQLRGGHAAFYIFDDESQTLNLAGAYALADRKRLNNKLHLGEGLVGQCALEKTPITLAKPPADYVAISSGTGEATPVSIGAYPLVQNNRLQGVLEIAAFHALEAVEQALLESVLPMIGLYLDNIDRSHKTTLLLQQTQEMANELKISDKELRLQAEELHANNDELQEKSEQLEQKTCDLQASEEEMRLSNEILEQKTKQMEEQQQVLEKSKQDIEAYSKSLEEANEHKSHFVANMSHELRTPLNSLLILANNMATNASGAMSEEDIYSAKIIYDSGQHLLELINNILDLSKIEAGKMELIYELIATAEISDNISRFFSHVTDEKGLSLNVSIAPDFPPQMVIDSVRLDQVFNNLLSNAIKFTEQGGIDVEFNRIKKKQAPPLPGEITAHVLAISVRDSGIGIANDKLTTIFEAFQQADGSTSRKYGGSGLGLAITQTLAHMMGGAIDVKSVFGAGTTFTLYLPESQQQAAIPETPTTQAATTANQGYVAPHTANATVIDEAAAPPFPDDRDMLEEGDKVILVIEDDEIFARIQYDQSRKNGFKCLVANNGHDGLLLARKHLPAGVMLDINMPGMDGWHVLSEFKRYAALRNIPVQMISAQEDDGKSKELGAVGYLTKPVSSDQLNETFNLLQSKSNNKLKRVLVIASPNTVDEKMLASLRKTDAEILIEQDTLALITILKNESIDCIIMSQDLNNPGSMRLLADLSSAHNQALPLIIYSSTELDEETSQQVREYTQNIIVEGGHSQERLQSEVELFFHSIKEAGPNSSSRNTSAQISYAGISGKTILLVDDDMRNVFALSKTLKSQNINVIMAKDGQKAQERLEQNKDVDLVLMDIMMPGVNGYDAMQNIRKLVSKTLPIIAVTAKSGQAEKKKCLQLGANDYIAKPVDIAQLLEKINALLNDVER